MQRRRRRGIITLRNCADYENVENPAGETSEGGEKRGEESCCWPGNIIARVEEKGGRGEGGREVVFIVFQWDVMINCISINSPIKS